MEGLGKALVPCAGKALPVSLPSPRCLWGPVVTASHPFGDWQKGSWDLVLSKLSFLEKEMDCVSAARLLGSPKASRKASRGRRQSRLGTA